MRTNCEYYQNVIEESLDGTLPAAMAAEFDRHLQTCTECQQLLNLERSLRRELLQLPVPPMRAEFPAEAMEKVRQAAGLQSVRKGFIAGFGSAIAAGLALWFVLTLTIAPQGSEQTLHTVNVRLGELRTVNLVFDSPEAFEQTSFALMLPANAELEGYPGRHEFTWTGSLQKGKNRLTLPLRVAAPGDGVIVARISRSDEVKVFRLKLKVGPQSDVNVTPRNLT